MREIIGNPSGTPFLRAVESNVDELGTTPDLLSEIAAEKLDVIIIREFLARSTMEGVRQSLLHDAGGVYESRQKPPGWNGDPTVIFGDALWTSYEEPKGPPLGRYFENAELSRLLLRRLFASEAGDYEHRLSSTFGALAGGRRARTAEYPDGRAYAPSTIRCIPPGLGSPFHIDNYFDEVQGYAHLTNTLNLTYPTSFFAVMSEPDRGGELHVSELRFNDPRIPADRHTRKDHSPFAYQAFPLTTGDLVIFASGRFWHRITPVEGTQPRWTIGGMLGLTRDGDGVRYWA